VEVLSADDPSSNISFSTFEFDDRIFVLRDGDGIVLNLGGVASASWLTMFMLGIGSVIVAESVIIFVFTISVFSLLLTGHLSKEDDRTLPLSVIRLATGFRIAILRFGSIRLTSVYLLLSPTAIPSLSSVLLVSLEISVTFPIPPKAGFVDDCWTGGGGTLVSFFIRSDSAIRSCMVRLMRPSDREPRRFNGGDSSS
jgi:hypothetical protein